MNKHVVAAVLAIAVVPVGVMAQDPQVIAGQATGPGPVVLAAQKLPEHFYRLSFAVEEVNDSGKVTNGRSYAETINTGRHNTQEIRTGAKIPVSVAENQWNYMDVGVNFDVFEPREIGEKLAFNLTADVSSLATPANGGSGAASHPVVRQNRWSSDVVITPGKPTVVFSADDLEDKGKMQVEVTAVKVE